MATLENVIEELNASAEAGDFETAIRLLRENQALITKKYDAAQVKEVLKKAATKDRLLLSFLESAAFGARPLEESLVRLERLMRLKPGSLVLCKSLEWGLGVVKRLDHFYRKITVDFRAKRAHQFSYDAALDMLTMAGENHILVLQHTDPGAFAALMKDKPGEFIKEMLKSFGDMSVQRLEDVAVKCGFVKAANWKALWERARGELRGDKSVLIPVKRTEAITLRAVEETYGTTWLTAFSHETDPKQILAGVREYLAQQRAKVRDALTPGAAAAASQDADARTALADRLAFALTAAKKVDDALYARLAITVRELGFETPTAEEMREYLWERRRFIGAAAQLPAREVGAMIAFLAVDGEARARICKAIPELPYTAVQEVISQFVGDDASRKAIADYMRQPKAPATLTVLFAGSYSRFEDKWPELPPFINLLAQAVALGEGRQNGETLRMQNIIRRLFADKAWLENTFAQLDEAERALLFERFQASIAWDPATHHTIVVRMVRLAPELESHVVRVEKKKEYARVTSARSYGQRKREYLKLINEDMPENVRKIEEAKSYGDLSENAEYQYAKDEQRVLMQKQTLMQAELEAVSSSDFADATTDEVMPGVTVVVATEAGEKTYTILGEWDNDIERGVISSKTRLAQNMLGKKAGDEFELPQADGRVAFGRVKEIRALGDDIRAWMAG